MEYRHYYRIDANGFVIYAFSEAFEAPQEGDFLVEYGARQFTPVILNARSQYTLRVVNGVVVERTEAELDAEWNAQPPAPETDAEKIARIESQLAKFIDFYFAQNPDQLAEYEDM